jgi:hypothetical protein
MAIGTAISVFYLEKEFIGTTMPEIKHVSISRWDDGLPKKGKG